MKALDGKKHVDGRAYAGLTGIVWRQPSIRRFYMAAWLSNEAGAHSDGGKSSRTSEWSICAITGCACLF